MLKISYPIGSFDFPHYYSQDAWWFPQAEMETKRFFCDCVKPNFNIIDAGANIGMYTVLFSKLAAEGKIHAFEPTDTISMLKQNVDYNQCGNNIIFLDQPLGQFDGIKQDKVFKIWSQSVIVEKEFDFITLDTYVLQNNLKIDLIKIDVDSYDYEVLLGGRNFFLSQNPIVVVELNQALAKRGYAVKDAVEYMKSIGYKLVRTLDSNENYVFTK